MAHFSKNKFVILDNPKPRYSHGEVEVTGVPDLYVDDGGKKCLIRLDFSVVVPQLETINIILKVMHEASLISELGVHHKDVIYLDVSRQKVYPGAKLNKKLKQDIDAACDTIADIWPKIKQT